MRGGQDGLTYDTVALGDLVNKDTDGDGILDWEEPLWGLDPTKLETTPGVPDSSVIKKLKAEQGYDVSIASEGSENYTENLTETDKFSRELFSIIASLNQSEMMDAESAEIIAQSLVEKIQNSERSRIFTVTDIKIGGDLYNNFKNYNDTLNNIFTKNPPKGNVLDIMQRFIIDENNIDSSVLYELDPIINSTRNVVEEMSKIEIPKSVAVLHVEVLNGMEKLAKNLEDIKQYDTDSILALAGISQYENSVTLLKDSIKKLAEFVYIKLNN